MQSQRLLGVSLVLALALVGCGGDDDNSLKVSGNATVVVTATGASSSFNFPTSTLLYDDRVSPDNGVIAGHCTLQRGPVGVPDVIDVGITRTGTSTDLGIRSISVRVDDPGLPLAGSVTAAIGADSYTSEAGSDCNIQLLSYDVDARIATIAVSDCTIATSASATATATASLEFTNCDVR
ncbi:MAG: hypothetical protein IPK60_22660 [Sandaracinaceae bacterium]|nr:hypothetical protein [Sandaracinaceae bacterium]